MGFTRDQIIGRVDKPFIFYLQIMGPMATFLMPLSPKDNHSFPSSSPVSIIDLRASM